MDGSVQIHSRSDSYLRKRDNLARSPLPPQLQHTKRGCVGTAAWRPDIRFWLLSELLFELANGNLPPFVVRFLTRQFLTHARNHSSTELLVDERFDMDRSSVSLGSMVSHRSGLHAVCQDLCGRRLMRNRSKFPPHASDKRKRDAETTSVMEIMSGLLSRTQCELKSPPE